MEWVSRGQAVVGRLFGRFSRPEQADKTSPSVAIVRRGLSQEYYFFFEIFAKQNGLDVVVDRRVDDRRRRLRHVFGNRRAKERRGLPPPTWSEADVVIPHQDRQVGAPMEPRPAVVPSTES